MSTAPNQSCFLQRLLLYEGSLASRELCERLAVLERNERSLRRACRLVTLISMLGFSGLAYGAVLLPQFFDNSTHWLIRLSGAIGLGSAACLLVFFTLWTACRAAGRRHHAECRAVVVKMLAERLPGFNEVPLEPVVREGPRIEVGIIRAAFDAGSAVRADAHTQRRSP